MNTQKPAQLILVLILSIILCFGCVSAPAQRSNSTTILSPNNTPEGQTDNPVTDEMILIPAGSFQMGCDPDHNGGEICYAAELPLHTVTLDAYYIDKYEVTNEKYALCVAAGGCSAIEPFSSYTRTSYYDNQDYANFPVVKAGPDEAEAYCRWAGKRLPTEAEWEKAARGPTARAYPWGDEAPTCNMANFNARPEACIGDTNAVGSYPAGASPYGVMDMAGNVEEWVSDWWSDSYYSISPASNPKGPDSGLYRITRGGPFTTGESNLRVAYRALGSPSEHCYCAGFRCAASIP